MKSPAPAEVMDITNMLNTKGAAGASHLLSGNPVDHHHFIKADHLDRAHSPHGSEHSRYSTPHSLSRPYPSPSAMEAPMHIQTGMPTPLHIPSYPDMTPVSASSMHMHQLTPQSAHSQSSPQPAKAFACANCGKGFARRSDLARHERIHTGVRPHVCEYEGCGKMFIQRSALTVHERVHTGEKPHHCETCAKPFSDSSSLARHRRTHSGKRPYKCPYADCQKTFTRRTTLTRHENRHSGTIEEAAAATAAVLAANKPKPMLQTRSESDHMSNHGSPLTTPSPAQRHMSMSPSMDLSGAPGMGRHADFPYLQQNGAQYLQQNPSLPVHLRVGSPASTTSNGYGGIRPTSHPTGYGPPAVMEPSIDHHHHQSTPTSANGSPHLSAMGWQSPAHVSHASSPAHHPANYAYPEPEHMPPHAAHLGQMYYTANPTMRRPTSNDHGLMHMS